MCEEGGVQRKARLRLLGGMCFLPPLCSPSPEGGHGQMPCCPHRAVGGMWGCLDSRWDVAVELASSPEMLVEAPSKPTSHLPLPVCCLAYVLPGPGGDGEDEGC